MDKRRGAAFKEKYQVLGNKEITGLLKGRKTHQVTLKTNRMGLKRSDKLLHRLRAAGRGKPVTEGEISLILEQYKERGILPLLQC